MVDSIINSINEHIEERLAQGENESVAFSHKSHKGSEKSIKSKMSSMGKSEVPELPAIVEHKQLEAKEAEERLQKNGERTKGKGTAKLG